jgi:SAM-dependent methyltransferase
MAPDTKTALRSVQSFIADRLAGNPVHIYEAGGGSLSVLPLDSLNAASVTVVDIDEDQLRNNKYATIKILGDIQTHNFAPGSIDLVVCYNVIEHLHSPDLAIECFHRALKPGGVLFIGAPNPQSIFGLITKYTPHLLHVWIYRVILKNRDAGKPGRGPFPVIFHPIVSPHRLLRFCEKTGFEVRYFSLYTSPHYAFLTQKQSVLGFLLRGISRFINMLPNPRLRVAEGDYHAVFEKVSRA